MSPTTEARTNPSPTLAPPPPAHIPVSTGIASRRAPPTPSAVPPILDNRSTSSLRRSRSATPSSVDNRLEATELQPVRARRRAGAAAAEEEENRAASGGEEAEEERRGRRVERPEAGWWWEGVKRFWGRQVRVTVPAGTQRDHLALERTFLGYLRTSIALSMLGVLLAQLFRLEHVAHPDPTLGYYVLGTPLAAAFIIAAMAVALIGAFRFWRLQNAMVRGKCITGGWEIVTLMVGSLLLTCTVLILLIAVDLRKEEEDS